MLRITPLQQDTRVARFRVEGQLTQQTAEELKASCTTPLGHPRTLLLDLSEVTFADATGVAILHGLVEQDAVLIGCSGFLSELLQLYNVEKKSTCTHASVDDAFRETQLIKGLRRQEDVTFEQLVRQYSGRLLATARRMLG